MMDFYDVWMMSRERDFTGSRLARAIQTTFQRRRTELPHTTPTVLTEEFAGNAVQKSLGKAGSAVPNCVQCSFTVTEVAVTGPRLRTLTYTLLVSPGIALGVSSTKASNVAAVGATGWRGGASTLMSILRQ